MLDWSLRLQGSPYLWGAKGQERPGLDGKPVRAFDCSGFVTCGFQYVGHKPDWRETHSAARLWDELEPIDEAEDVFPMDLAFYGPPSPDRHVRITHVMFVWGDGRVYGAAGGRSSTTSLEVAARQNALVQFRPRVDYRLDFRGYRRAPN